MTVHMEHTVIELLLDGGRAAGVRRLRPRARPLPRVLARRRSSWPPAASAAPTRSPATAGKAPATATRWRIAPAPSSSTWSSSSSIPPAWSGRPACAAFWSPKACAAKAASSRTAKAAASCSTTSPTTTSRRRRRIRKKGWRYTQGDKSARRPPELLTRDHVARCINREVKAGRGSPHGGVFLDIAWIKEKIKDSEEHIKRKLPSMYHQFKELADLDITKEPMEVGPTTHYIMGGIRVDADTQMSTIPGSVRGRRMRVGHQRRQSPGRQLAVGPDRVRQARRRIRRAVRARERPAASRRRRGSSAAMQGRAGAVRARRDGREPVQGAGRPAGHDAGARRHRPHRERDAGSARGAFSELQGARGRASASPATASTTPAGTRRSTCGTC